MRSQEKCPTDEELCPQLSNFKIDPLWDSLDLKIKLLTMISQLNKAKVPLEGYNEALERKAVNSQSISNDLSC